MHNKALLLYLEGKNSCFMTMENFDGRHEMPEKYMTQPWIQVAVCEGDAACRRVRSASCGMSA